MESDHDMQGGDAVALIILHTECNPVLSVAGPGTLHHVVNKSLGVYVNAEPFPEGVSLSEGGIWDKDCGNFQAAQ